MSWKLLQLQCNNDQCFDTMLIKCIKLTSVQRVAYKKCS